jgi:hypothetical protein
MLRNSWVRARQLGVAALLAVGAMTIVQTTALAGPSTQLAQASYNEATINNFVTAARQIVELRKSYEPRLQAAESKEAAQKLVDEVRGLMLVAIKGVGFTQKEYAEIARTAQADPTLRARVEALITAP